jgi:hypothetical protein
LPTTTIVYCGANNNAELAVDSIRSYSGIWAPSDGDHSRSRLNCFLTLVLMLSATSIACSTAPPPADNARAMSDIAARNSGSEEVVTGTVVQLLPNSHGPSGIHERFIVDVRTNDSSIPLYVTDNISVGQLAPLHIGDRVIVKGQLAFNDHGPLLHWTHRDPRMRHPPGFVEVGGHIYE